MTTKSGKHANKTFGSAKDKSAKVVDMRKVAALSAGAAGVIAGAAIAFGATPAMAADATSASVKTNDPAKEQNLVASNKAEDSKKTATDTAKKDDASKVDVSKKNSVDAKPVVEAPQQTKVEAPTDSKKSADAKQSVEPKVTAAPIASTESTEENKTGKTEITKSDDVKADNKAVDNKKDVKQDAEEASTPSKSVARSRKKRDLSAENHNQGEPVVGTDRDANPEPSVSDQINISEDTKNSVPNMYAWGSSNNTYIKNGQNNTVTFNFAKPTDGSKITSIAIFPAQNNSLTTDRGRKSAEYYSGNTGLHQSYSGEYTFTPNDDGSATLKMAPLFREGKVSGGAEAYGANRCIYVYGTKDGGNEVLLYKTNIARAATLIPPKTAGSIVLKYNQELTAQQIQDKLKSALDAPTEAKNSISVREQIKTASTSKGVGGNTGANGAFVQTPDTAENKVIINAQRAYNPGDITSFNTTTSKQGDTEKTYITTVRTLKTHLITDTGYNSDDLPLTVARYDTRIDKPIVDDVDIAKLTQEQKTEIIRKLAQLNHVPQDKVTFNENGEAVIHFDGVDEKDAPKIALRDLVLKKFTEDQIKVPAESTATVIYNPLAYSDAEIKSIKKAIYEANKDKTELGLSATDYEKQITLSYLTGNLTATGDSNKGISNGQAENTITVKIKTDKAVAEFKSDVKAHKLTRLADIRKDYNVSWKQNKIDGRDSDEGLSWSEDGKTIIYRYDPTAAKEFDTNKILDLLKATAKDKNSGLRDLTGNEKLDHEGVDGKAKKSHVGYVIKDDQPTTELSLGNMSGAYWQYSQKVDNSGVDLGNEESNAGSYSWDKDAKPVVVAAKQDKVYKARLFVLPYGLTMYRNVYMENGNQPWNTPKAINVIFVPQTNHKTKDLSKSIGEHKTENVEGKDVPTQSSYYNASDAKKKAYDDALKVAQQTLEKVGTTTDDKLSEQLKAEVDNATIKLDKARAELDGADTNKDKLNASIEANGKAPEGQTAATPGTVTTDRYKNVTDQAFQTDDGKPDTKKNEAAKKAKEDYDKALEEAKKLKDDVNATQRAVDEAKAKLDAAREKLNEFSTNKDKLNAAIAEHGQVKNGKTGSSTDITKADPAYQNATKEEREAYDNAVKKANDLSADPNASQKDVNAAIDALQKAKKALDLKATDKSQLITAEKLTFDNPDKDDANKQSTFYKNALNKQTNGASEQEKQNAKTAVDNYNNALAKAREVIADKNATQAQVDDAKKKLDEAEKVLHEKYATDANELTKVLADNFSGYLMPAYFNAFDKAQAGDADAKKAFKDYNDAYQKAKDLKQKLEEAKNGGTAPAQKLIDEAKTALEKARTVIDKYATNTSRLSAAVFNDLAIQNSPAYKNASDKDASADAKAAKDRYDKAVEKLHQALNKKMPKDKDEKTGQDIPDTNIPVKDGNLDDKDYLKNIQAHAKGEPLDKDIDAILKEMNDAAAELNKFATKTDELLKSVNEDAATHQNPAYKNASQPDFKNDDGTENTAKKEAAKKAVDEYGAALNAAKDLLKNPAATQKEVNEALKTLNEKRTALDAYNTDTTKLKASVKKHGTKADVPAPEEGTLTSDAYRNASDPHFMKEQDGKLVPDDTKNNAAKEAKKKYDEALTKAQELLKKHDNESTPQDAKPTQKDINEALKALDEARTKLDTYKTDTTALNTEAEKSQADAEGSVATGKFEDSPEFKNAKAKTSDGNENTDVTAYKKALATARKLVSDAKDTSKKNSERPTQQQINEALDALKAAKKQITDNYKTNLEPLTSAKDFADDGFKKTPEYKNAVAKKAAGDQGATNDLGKDGEQTGFDNVLKKVAEKLNDEDWKKKATQKDVSALLKQLQAAQEKIAKTYKTDAKLLENEVGDKDQDGRPVTPKFEESIPYKNALEKKNAGDTDATTKLKDYNDKLKAAQELINKVNNPDPNAKPEDRPTQKDVDDALAALKQAKKAIDDTFTTKVDALKKETKELKDDGGAKEDKDKFENSTEFKNASAKTDADSKKDVQTYKDALKKANELLGKFDENGKPKPGEKDIPSQKEVDEALKNLKEIKDKITKNYVTSPHDLQDEVDKSKDGDTDTSTDVFENTPAFKNATAKGDEAAKQALKDYNDKLAEAKRLLGAFNRNDGTVKDKKDFPAGMDKAPTQQELDAALDALKAAKKKITDDYSTNKSDLDTEAGKDSDFTKTPEYQNAQAKGDDASKQALEGYKKALEDAKKVLGDKNATQAQVDDALKKLQDAKSKLTEGYKTDKTDLTAEAGKNSDFTKTPEYQNAVGSPEAEAYKKALDEANRILGDKYATQAQVDEALKKLQDAKQKLADSHKTDKSDLNTEAGNDPDFRKSIPFIIGKAADVAEYQQALNDANSVINDPNATQDQVDQALRRLRAAKQKLIDSYNRLINSGSGSDYDFGTSSDVNTGVGDNTGVGVNDSNATSVNNVADKGALQAEVDAALGDVSANANGVVADSSLVSEFNAALDYARSVLADANATQGQVDSALARLRAARAALREGMLAARNSAGMNLKRGDVSGVNTGASSSVFAAFAAVFAGLGVAGAASKRRRHSAR